MSFANSPWLDRGFRGLTRSFALGQLALFVATIATLAVGAWPALRAFGPGFFASATWDPAHARFGALAPLAGTLVTSGLALLLAVPVSFGIAIVLTRLAPAWLAGPLALAIDLLAAVPSLIYGMWGLFVFAPAFARDVEPWMIDHLAGVPLVGALFEGTPMGIGLFTASLILAVMVIPFVTAITRDVFARTPPMLVESAYGLGATTWEVVWRVIVPHSRVGLVSGAVLGLGRALGETMAVTFVIGNSHRPTFSLFMPGTTIASTLANEFTEATGELHTSALVALGLTLFLVSSLVLAVVKVTLIGSERVTS